MTGHEKPHGIRTTLLDMTSYIKTFFKVALQVQEPNRNNFHHQFKTDLGFWFVDDMPIDCRSGRDLGDSEEFRGTGR